VTVDRLDSKIDKLIAIVAHRTRDEQELEAMITELGGRGLVIGDPSKFEKAAGEIVRKKDRGLRDKPSGSGEEVGNPGQPTVEVKPRTTIAKDTVDKIPPKIVNPSVRHALTTSLVTLLEENAQIYYLKLQEQTRQIKDALDTSTRWILQRFDAGPPERILNPVRLNYEQRQFSTAQLTFLTCTQEIQGPWRDMNWWTSVKARHFVTSLHDHFID
jgi:hypothetical protein